jgi:hypothetical protein
MKEDGILNHFCIKGFANESADTQITGTWSGSLYRWLQISYRVCNNETDNKEGIICAPKEEIISRLEGNFISVSFQNSIIDFKDYKNPIQKYVISRFASVSTKFFKEKSLFFRNLKLQSDTGLIFEALDS